MTALRRALRALCSNIACSTLLLGLLTAPAAWSSETTPSEAHDQNKLDQLSHERQWLDLLHYHDVGIVGDVGSQIDDPDFFLSPDGASDPSAELKASITGFTSTDPDHVQKRCAYPARYYWLKSKLGDHYFGGETPCPEFEKWRDELATDGLTLIFPAAYLNSPSSMFGHTLMRLDSSNSKSELLAYSINYAANADPNDNELVFSYKGLTGGYPGVFSVLPYYEKVKEYNYLESRDVWEYELDITADELAQFVRHVWEVKDAHFDYYFFTENCSYHLLTLLDAASDRFELSKEFTTDVIPADTVRVLNEKQLIKKASFRPSMQTTLQHRLASSSNQAQVLAIDLVQYLDTPLSELLNDSALSEQEQAQALELSVSLARYKAKQDKENASNYNKRSIRLLSARSKLGDIETFTATPTPMIRDDEGHRSHRWMARAGEDQIGTYVGLDLRMSYHDFLDPVAGYIPGAQLEIIHLKAKAYTEKASLQIEEFRAIDIASFSPRDGFIKPISWFVSTGLTRNEHQIDELMPYLKAGPGVSYGLASAGGISLIGSGLLSTRAFVDNDLDKGFVLESGPKVQLSLQHPDISIQTYWERHYKLAGADLDQQKAFLGIGHGITNSTSLRIGASYTETDLDDGARLYDTSGELGFAWYF